VLVKDGKRAKATCLGKGATTDFLYDLTPGTDEGIVNVVLTIGQIRYCTAFDDLRGRDGSDGKRFEGRDAPAPGPCPTPPTSTTTSTTITTTSTTTTTVMGSPSAAFLAGPCDLLE
jgi:hypothetical protein